MLSKALQALIEEDRSDPPIKSEEFEEIIRADELKNIEDRRKSLKKETTILLSDEMAGSPDKDAVGLALSGGGIRSATFSLGILQRLAELKILPLVDYLSTVSGGGYIGGWWSSWMCRPNSDNWLPAPNPKAPAEEPPEIRHLRLYSNYLIPRKGLFSPDTWRAITILLRNLFVTQVMIAAMLAALFLLVDALYLMIVPDVIKKGTHANPLDLIWPYPLLGVAAIWFLLTVVFLCVASGYSDKDQRKRTKTTQIHAWFAVIVTVLVGLITLAGFSDLLLSWLNDEVRGKGGWLAILPGIASAIYTAIAKAPTGGGDLVGGRESKPKEWVLKIAPLLFLLTLAVLLAAGVWWLLRATYEYMNNSLTPKNPDWVLSVSLLLVFGISQLYFLRSLATRRLGLLKSVKGEPQVKRDPQNWLLLFIAILSLACGVYLYTSYTANHTSIWWIWLACFLVMLQISIGAGFASDPNSLSMYSFYRSRLVAAYLGATNRKRLDDMDKEVSEVAEGDDLHLSALAAWKKGGPIHLLNTTLNLVGAKDLTSKQRQAEVFELTPLFCGSDRTGYRHTKEYADNSLTLGSAVAISGAAASTNMGSNTSVPLAMLMSFFNVRLGFWTANPKSRAWRYPWTRFWLWYQLREMLGQTTAQGRFSFLSDGGHLENLGLYPLIKRRCRFIILCDAAADPEYRFGDLANALRMARIDFRCEVELDLTNLRPIPDESNSFRRSFMHYSVGQIRYPDATPPSTLIYLKSSLTGTLPDDVQGYAQTHSAFPHQSTADQFFDEAQFESYRCLGYNVADAAFSKGVCNPAGLKLTRERFFEGVLEGYRSRVAELQSNPAAPMTVAAASKVDRS
jgi:hypothetical protein